MMADSFWTSVQAASGLSAGYARLGRVQPLPENAALDLALARGENARQLWQGQAGWHVLNERPSWDASTSRIVEPLALGRQTESPQNELENDCSMTAK